MPDKRKDGYANRYDPCVVCHKPTDQYVKEWDGRDGEAFIACHKKCEREYYGRGK